MRCESIMRKRTIHHLLIQGGRHWFLGLCNRHRVLFSCAFHKQDWVWQLCSGDTGNHLYHCLFLPSSSSGIVSSFLHLLFSSWILHLGYLRAYFYVPSSGVCQMMRIYQPLQLAPWRGNTPKRRSQSPHRWFICANQVGNDDTMKPLLRKIVLDALAQGAFFGQ